MSNILLEVDSSKQFSRQTKFIYELQMFDVATLE